MSAYIVSDNHINAIVSYFANRVAGEGLWTKIDGQYNYLTPDNAHHIAYELYRENVRSVDYRYSEANGDEDYTFTYLRHVKDVYTVGDIAKALDGLEYQSCERDDYHHSQAYQILHDMRKALLSKVCAQEGVEHDTWSIDEVRKAERVYI